MKTMKFFVILPTLAFVLAFYKYVEAQYQVPHHVIGNGDVAVNNGSYRLNGTVGQPGIGVVSNTSHINEVGFWYLTDNIFTNIEPVSNSLPKEFRLDQNYPNPFNPQTTITFALPVSSSATLKLFDIVGREVASLVDEELQPGEHKVVLDARGFSSGVYFFQIQTAGFVMTRKLALVK